MVELSGLDSNKYKAILRFKSQIPELIGPSLTVNMTEGGPSRKRIDQFGEIAVKRLKQPYKIEFSQDEIKTIIAAYQTGTISTLKLAEEYGCSKTTISKLLKQHNIEVTNTKAQIKLDTKRVISMYAGMCTTEEIAKQFGVSPSTINKCLRKNGVKIRNRWDYSEK